VKFGDYADVIPQATRSELRRCFPSGEAAMWGIRPGQGNGPNQREYGKMRVGDTVLFYDHSRFFAAATVASLFPNPGLAERLWPRHPSGQIFEYMYALDEVRTLDLSYAEFNPIVGYKDMSRNVTVLDEARSQASSSACPWKAAASRPPPVRPTTRTPWTVARRRTEQDYLRHLLFPGIEATCHLCGRRFKWHQCRSRDRRTRTYLW
jgi:hypothetical protein